MVHTCFSEEVLSDTNRPITPQNFTKKCVALALTRRYGRYVVCPVVFGEFDLLFYFTVSLFQHGRPPGKAACKWAKEERGGFETEKPQGDASLMESVVRFPPVATSIEFVGASALLAMWIRVFGEIASCDESSTVIFVAGLRVETFQHFCCLPRQRLNICMFEQRDQKLHKFSCKATPIFLRTDSCKTNLYVL